MEWEEGICWTWVNKVNGHSHKERMLGAYMKLTWFCWQAFTEARLPPIQRGLDTRHIFGCCPESCGFFQQACTSLKRNMSRLKPLKEIDSQQVVRIHICLLKYFIESVCRKGREETFAKSSFIRLFCSYSSKLKHYSFETFPPGGKRKVGKTRKLM